MITWDLIFWISATGRTAFSTISNIAYTILTAILVIVSMQSINTTRQLAQNNLQYQKDQRKIEKEEFVLREDIYATTISVYSSDSFKRSKRSIPLPWKYWFLKVYSLDSWLIWKYKLIYPYNVRDDKWNLLWSDENVIEKTGDIDSFKHWFMTKRACLEYVMTSYELTSTDIQWEKWVFNAFTFQSSKK